MLFGTFKNPKTFKGRCGYERWREAMIKTLAHLEAVIDFSEEDLPRDLFDRVSSSANELASEIDAHLSDRDWVSGRGLTLADISIAATLMYREPTKLPLQGYAHLLRYLDRVSVLPTWQATAAARMQ